MATYEQYMNAARNADAAGDEAAARQLVQAAKALQSQQPTQPEISTAEDVARSLGSGMVRGAIAIPETLEMAGRGIRRLGEEAYQLVGGEVEEETPVLKSTIGEALRGLTSVDDYQPKTTAGQYAGTVGEFLPAAIGGPVGVARAAAAKGVSTAAGRAAVGEAARRAGSLTGQAALAGAASEAAGQATEGTELEPYARIAGALAAPYTANKTLSALQKKNAKSPTIASLKAEKNAAYQALKSEGTGLTGTQTAYLIDDMKSVLNMDDIILSAKPSVERALKLLNEVEDAGAMNLAKFNELQKALGKIYRSAPDAPEVLTMMSKMDDALVSNVKDAGLMTAAKAANAKYMKSQMLDRYFTAAMEGAKKGRIVPNTGEALQNTATRILKNEKNMKFWSPDEVAALRSVAQGSIPTRVMGAVGKLSPTSGGMMAALNVIIAAANPVNALDVIGMTATTFAKLGYNAKVKKSRKALEDLVRAGGVKEPSKVITKELVEDMVARIGGLTAMETQGQ
ncbi:MAG: hypothetical protein ACO23H_13250 [Alphaproteobacteria bacterium]